MTSKTCRRINKILFISLAISGVCLIGAILAVGAGYHNVPYLPQGIACIVIAIIRFFMPEVYFN